MAEAPKEFKPTREQVVADLLRLGELLALHARPVGALGLTRRIRSEESERLKTKIAELEERIEIQAYERNNRALRSVLGLQKDEVLDLILLRCIAVVAFEALDNFRPVSTVSGVSKAAGLGGDWKTTLLARHAIRQAIIKGDAIAYSEGDCEGGALKAGWNLIRFMSGENRLGILWTEESIRQEKEEVRRRNGNVLKRTPALNKVSKPALSCHPLPPAILKGCESPKAIYATLSRTVLGMDDTDTLRRFSVAMSLHMRRANLVRQNIVPSTPCQTLCIAGESGVGKTFMVEEFCKNANLIYTSGSLAEVTCSGYSGLDLTDIYAGLFRNGAKRAEVEAGSIVFFDEADKRKINDSQGVDCTGAALQAELLRMVEGTDIQLGGRRSNSGSGLMISTRGLAFCFAGCFSGVTEAMASKKRHLGFGSSVENVSQAPDIREALTAYFLPELCNRISTIIYIKPPVLEALIKIATAPNGVLEMQNQFLGGLGLTLKPGGDAIREICSYAHSSKTYARGVRSLFQALAEEAIFEEWQGELVIGAGEVRRAIEGLKPCGVGQE